METGSTGLETSSCSMTPAFIHKTPIIFSEADLDFISRVTDTIPAGRKTSNPALAANNSSDMMISFSDDDQCHYRYHWPANAITSLEQWHDFSQMSGESESSLDAETTELLERIVNPPKLEYQVFVCYEHLIHQNELDRFSYYLREKLGVSELEIVEIMPFHQIVMFKILKQEAVLLQIKISKLRDAGYLIMSKEDYLASYPSIL